MSDIYTRVVRVGVLVERRDSEWVPFHVRMFHIRQKKDHDLIEWAEHCVGLHDIRYALPGVQNMRIGEQRRFWARLRLEDVCDYWGEHDECVQVLSCRPA